MPASVSPARVLGTVTPAAASLILTVELIGMMTPSDRRRPGTTKTQAADCRVTALTGPQAEVRLAGRTASVTVWCKFLSLSSGPGGLPVECCREP